MGLLSAVMEHPEELLPLMRLKKEVEEVEKKIPPQPHWAFCYSLLTKVSRSFALVIQRLGHDQLRDAVCVFYLVTRALDTIEDDTSIPNDTKVPILESYYLHFYESDWQFLCGIKDYKDLMDNFHHVKKAFLELDKSYQEAIVETCKVMGAGMAKFITKEVTTLAALDEYCYYVAGVVAIGLYKPFGIAGVKNLPSETVGISTALLLQKTNIIRDYLEDINELPRPRMFWPREIWGKYASKLEDFKNKEFSKNAVECLNDLVTNALMHAKDSLECASGLQDPILFRSCSIPQIMAIGTLALCYNNLEVFRGVVKMRRGLVAKIFYETKTISDVYNAFYEFSDMVISKINMNDPNAGVTLKIMKDLQQTCIDSGRLNRRRFYIQQRKPVCGLEMVLLVFLLLSIVAAVLLYK